MTRRRGPQLGRAILSSFFPLLLVLLAGVGSALNADGVLLLSFKYAALADPLGVLDSWNYADDTPCAWTGVACAAFPVESYAARVVSLALPGSRILGSLPSDLGSIQHLRQLDVSGNFLNGTLPPQLFNASELQILNLANNEISDQFPELVGALKSLEGLNLSDNAFTGRIPAGLGTLPNLTVVSLSNNYFSGDVPAGLRQVQLLDLSSNLLNCSLTANFTGEELKYLNLSANRFSGEIPPDLAARVPADASVDFSSNNFTGAVPAGFFNRKPEVFAGNPNLCGRPLRNPCVIASTLSLPPNVSDSPPAIAAIPKTLEDAPAAGGTSAPAIAGTSSGLKPGVIAGIVFGDLAGIGVLAIVFLYVYQARKKKRVKTAPAAEQKGAKKGTGVAGTQQWSSPESGGRGWSCLRKKGGGDAEETSETTASDSDSEQSAPPKKGSLVTVDGESPALEMETLLKASAYILGATGSSIVYKAVLEDGTTLAVRRVGETGVERFRDFENQVRHFAKLRHPNLVRIRGFYWGEDEKLIIYDYLPNGSLASFSYKKMGSSPLNLSWEVRLRIMKGVARGLAYLHEKKLVHCNLKPSNILLGEDMEPRIGDFGLERLLSGDTSAKTGSSLRHFGSKRSTLSRESLEAAAAVAAAPPPVGASPSSSAGSVSPYLAPEALKNLKPSPKWDVYSYGVLVLELLSGRVFSEKELSQWNAGFIAEDKYRVVRMADAGLRPEVEGKEEAVFAIFRLGFACCSPAPARRPSMKEALQVLDKIPTPSSLI